MTTLILTQKKILPLIGFTGVRKIAGRFYDLNQKWVITAVLTSIIIFSTVIYLTALFLTFDLGFKIQTAEKEAAALRNSASALEFQIQKEETSFVQNHKDVLGLMEKVSDIKYLTLENLAVSRPQPNY